MTSPSLSLGIAFVASMALAAAWDLRSRRIPNALTLGSALLAPILWFFVAGGEAATASLVGAASGLAVGMILFGLGAVGGGDAKLLMVLGAFLGPTRLLVALVFTGIIGAALAIAVAIREGRLMPVLFSTWQTALAMVTLGAKGRRASMGSPEALTVPYGLAIAGGGVVTWFLWSGVGS